MGAMVKTTQPRVEFMEVVIDAVQNEIHREVGSLRDEILAMNTKFDQRLAQLIKLHEEVARSTIEKAKENNVLSSLVVGVTSSNGATASFDHHLDF